MIRIVENYEKLREIELWNCRDKSYFIYRILQRFYLKKMILSDYFWKKQLRL